MTIANDKYICKDQDGNLLISIDDINEKELSQDPLFTHCLAVVKVGDDYLLNQNKWRNRYEIFGGCIEKGESVHDCIIRECFEELGFISSDITYLGAMRILLKPDYLESLCPAIQTWMIFITQLRIKKRSQVLLGTVRLKAKNQLR